MAVIQRHRIKMKLGNYYSALNHPFIHFVIYPNQHIFTEVLSLRVRLSSEIEILTCLGMPSELVNRSSSRLFAWKLSYFDKRGNFGMLTSWDWNWNGDGAGKCSVFLYCVEWIGPEVLGDTNERKLQKLFSYSLLC
jgi:hypothetical protein